MLERIMLFRAEQPEKAYVPQVATLLLDISTFVRLVQF